MSDDLISRKALLEKLEEWRGSQRYLISEEIWEIIKTMPVAIDREKVIDELQDTKDIPQDDSVAEMVSTKIWNKAIQKAIDIVEKGGIE